jgi:hypothetical protein
MRYSKRISTGIILGDMSGGDPSNPIHLEGLRDSAIQQGIPLDDIEVGYATNQEVVDMWKEHSADFYANNPMEKWKASMQRTDSGMPRYLEDLITDKFDGNAGPNLQVRYDTKIELRGTKP